MQIPVELAFAYWRAGNFSSTLSCQRGQLAESRIRAESGASLRWIERQNTPALSSRDRAALGDRLPNPAVGSTEKPPRRRLIAHLKVEQDGGSRPVRTDQRATPFDRIEHPCNHVG